MCDIRRFYLLRELYMDDFHKLGIYGIGRVWANAWDVCFRAPSRGGRGRWADVGFVVCFPWDLLVLSMSLQFQIPRPRAGSLESVKGLRQPANLPTENSRLPIPTRCTV